MFNWKNKTKIFVFFLLLFVSFCEKKQNPDENKIQKAEKAKDEKGVFHIHAAKNPISINGILTEWEGSDSIEIKNAYNDTFPTGWKKHKAVIKTLWDWDKLYIAFKVTDTKLNAYEIDNNKLAWKDDNVTLYLSTKPERSPLNYLGNYEYQIVVNINGTLGTYRGYSAFDTIAYKKNRDSLWHADVITGIKCNGTSNQNLDVDSGYSIELAIKWSSLDYIPRPDDILSADFCIEDRNSENYQYLFYDWCGLSKEADYVQPQKWGKIVLAGIPIQGNLQKKNQLNNQTKKIIPIAVVLIGIGLIFVVFAKKRKRESVQGDQEAAIIPPVSQYQELVQKAVAIIEEEYHVENLKTLDVAKKIFVSDRTLRRILQEEGKTTFRKALNDVRMKKAKEFLESTNLSVTEICFKIGYNNMSYFAGLFKSYFDITPVDYRKKVWKDSKSSIS